MSLLFIMYPNPILLQCAAAYTKVLAHYILIMEN